MKSVDKLMETLARHKNELKERFNVKEIGIFGSYVRGEQKRRSDVDVLVEFYEPIGWEFVDLKEFLEEILENEIDLVTVPALKPQLRDNILQEVVYA